MHFHLPKPLHGWRAFVGEVGIIVIGVLIALGAEQLVETIHERRELDQLRQSLRAELADSRARWENMRACHTCLYVEPSDDALNKAYDDAKGR